jgi:glycosyltransferase involved in cell wall biosynthesis
VTIRVALLAGSPVPFKIPLYRRLAAARDLDLTVIYASDLGVRQISSDIAGYGIAFRWDTDLLSGYHSRFLRGASRNKGYGVRFTQLADPDIVPLLARERFDVLWLEGYSSITHLLGLATQRIRHRGLVMREEQTLLHPRALTKTLAKEVAMRAVLGQLDAAVYISRENRRWLEHYGVAPERLFPSPYVPDTDWFLAQAAQLRPQQDVLRQEFGFALEDGPLVISTSRLVANKQPAMVLEAFRRVRAKHRCCLLIVGSGPVEDDLQERVRRDEIPSVKFAGFLNQSEVSRAYAAADIFMLLSKSGETFGMAVAEAMHFGLALVLSDKVGSGADLLGDGSNGYVVHRDDPDTAAAALERLVTDDELRARFGAASRERISSWTLDQAVDGAVRAIRFAADRARGRAPAEAR